MAVRPGRRCLSAAGALVLLLGAGPRPAAAQAFTSPRGVGGVTLAWQYVHNLGHRLSDGHFVGGGQSVTTSLLLEVEYGLSDRLSVTAGIPYVFARYTGKDPPFSGLPVDTCRCWHSSFADVAASLRYRLGDDTWAVTPVLRFGQPSHRYPFRGEAVVGKRLTEAQVGVLAGARLARVLPKATLQAGYTYTFVERALDEISIDRSNAFVDLGYALSRRLYLRASWSGLHTHGGLRLGSPTGVPFFPPGEFDTVERLVETDRLLRVRYMQVGGGASLAAGPLDVFASYAKHIWGRDAHNSHVFGAGATWYFGLPD